MYKIRNDLCVNNYDVETCFVELVNNHSRNVIIVYKPPGASFNDFTIDINVILEKVTDENKRCYIMGDFNINLLHYDTDIAVQTFIDTLSSQSFNPTISKPTRITDNRATLIDNYF